MRNKIKQIMNKEEGFTLVELLAVIVILGIIVAIAIPAVGKVIGNSQIKADAADAELIIDAARLYEVDKNEKIGSTGVKVETLVSEGYLELPDEKLATLKEHTVKRTNDKLVYSGAPDTTGGDSGAETDNK